ncbi:cell division control protein 45 homolog [Lolium perenne]|uniref:cell division control protein 45 homolog n=1 Tax=Lolium perenne TaxID=4522 RepID=UPI0021EAE053|nr:cell division control protein 45 homolog [Lolium perenne]
MVRELHADSFYARLRAAAVAAAAASSASSSPLLILPSAADADSLCALRILAHVLSADSVRFSVYPVASTAAAADLLASFSPDASSSHPPLCVLLINWGARCDLLRGLLPRGSTAFVVDSHRPVHLRNLAAGNDRVVVLFTADDERAADLSYDFDVSSLADASDLTAEGDADGVSDESDESDASDYDSDADGGRRKRRRPAAETNTNDPVRLFSRLRREYYRLGTFHGKPSGCLMYDLAHALRRNTNDLLWLACVSLADQFVHDRITNERYQAAVMELEHHVNGSGNLDPSGLGSVVTLKDGTRIRAPETSRIAYEDEPRLMLLREWTLFDSMLCSSYVATRLKTWTDNGLKKLKLLLARMGFPLADCQKSFQYMSMEVKRKMRHEFDRLLPEYGLTDFYYRSFLRVHGYKSKVSAADVVYGLTALLESMDAESKEECSAAEQFWVAYSALSVNNVDQLQKGMQSAIEIQRAILRQGSSAITKSGFIRSAKKFRWVKLDDPVDTAKLCHPQALTKFCFFLMDALKERGARMKPLVCACLAGDPEKVLVVGVCGKPRLGAIQGNAFGNAFRSAAEEIGADYFHDMFESSWIVLDVVAVSSFMIRLTEKL